MGPFEDGVGSRWVDVVGGGLGGNERYTNVNTVEEAPRRRIRLRCDWAVRSMNMDKRERGIASPYTLTTSNR